MTAKQLSLVHEEITRSIISAFFHVYNTLGYGFLESVYSAALTKVLRDRGHIVEREVRVVIRFEGEVIAIQRMDMLVDRKVIVENKAGDRLAIINREQLFNYISATEYEVGLLLHFGPKPTFERVYSPNTP